MKTLKQIVETELERQVRWYEEDMEVLRERLLTEDLTDEVRQHLGETLSEKLTFVYNAKRRLGRKPQ
jgi:hypothetical protein